MAKDGIIKSGEKLGKRALWVQRKSTGHLRRRLPRKRGESLLRGTKYNLENPLGLDLPGTLQELFWLTVMCTQRGCAALSCVSVNLWLSLWEWRKAAFYKPKYQYSGY